MPFLQDIPQLPDGGLAALDVGLAVRVVQAEQDRPAPPVLPRSGAVEEGRAEEQDAVRVGRGGVVGDEPALGGGGDADDAAVARPAMGEERELRGNPSFAPSLAG